MPTRIVEAWPAWRLWVEGKASLTEILGRPVTIDDVYDANVVLDEWHAAERRARK